MGERRREGREERSDSIYRERQDERGERLERIYVYIYTYIIISNLVTVQYAKLTSYYRRANNEFTTSQKLIVVIVSFSSHFRYTVLVQSVSVFIACTCINCLSNPPNTKSSQTRPRSNCCW